MPDPTDGGPRRPQRAGTRGRFSARSAPGWLNQASTKGGVLVLAGVVTLVLRNEDRWVNEIVGAVLVAWSCSEAWFRLVRLRVARTASNLAFPLVLLLGGVALLAGFGPRMSILLGATLLARALVLAIAQARRKVASHPAGWLVGATAIAGVTMVLLPETSVLGLRAVAGIAAIALGGILLLSGLSPDGDEQIESLDLDGAGKLASDWLRRQRAEVAELEAVAEGLFFEQPMRSKKQASFWVMMVLATAIASFAVIQDSTAVVIGAMLVAPLMTPIMGMAVSVVNGWGHRLRDSTAMVAAAVAVAVAVAWVIAAWLPSVGDLTSNAQVTSRVSPNLLDLCIALAAGAAGAYATVNPRVSSSLSGVAIAVALVPPLAVVGITLEAGLGREAGGASLLFLTNLVCIILAGSLVLVLTGYSPLPALAHDPRRQRRALWTIALAVVLIVIPLSLTSKDIWADSNNRGDTVDAVDRWLVDAGDLSSTEVDVDGTRVDITLTGSDPAPPVEDLEAVLTEAFGEPVDLRVRVVPSELLGS